MSEFIKDLESLINSYSLENGSDTPDFLLAEYMHGCLAVFEAIIKARDEWYGFQPPWASSSVTIKPPTSRKQHESSLPISATKEDINKRRASGGK